MTARIYDCSALAAWRRRDQTDAERRAEALEAFMRVEGARARLYSVARFWFRASLVLGAALVVTVILFAGQ